MHFLIYIPGKSGQAPAHFAEVGLAELYAGATFQDTAKGPDGGPGVIAGWVGPSGDLRCVPERQTWIPAVPFEGRPAGRYFVGVWNDAPPTAEELQRERGFVGYQLVLGDGSEWIVPKAARLPQRMTFGPDGPGLEPEARFADFFRETEGWYQAVRDWDEGRPVLRGEKDWWAFLVRALSLNYRLTVEVAARLGLFTTENRLSCLAAICDGFAMRAESEAEKKTEATPAAG